MEEKICCFTGHRTIEFRRLSPLCHLLDAEIERLVKEGYTTFRTGGALGFDTVAALRVLVMKRDKYDFIRLELCLPCKDQDAHWPERHKQLFSFIYKSADNIRYVGDRYTSTCMFERNRMMVDGSSFCIAYFNPSSTRGGTKYTFNYAKTNQVPCLNLFPLTDR